MSGAQLRLDLCTVEAKAAAEPQIEVHPTWMSLIFSDFQFDDPRGPLRVLRYRLGSGVRHDAAWWFVVVAGATVTRWDGIRRSPRCRPDGHLTVEGAPADRCIIRVERAPAARPER